MPPIADFIYTTCPAECPMMTSKMKKVADQVNADVELVSISVDPEHDTPAALRAVKLRLPELHETQEANHFLKLPAFRTSRLQPWSSLKI